jgi:hypothetical protein
MAWGTAIALQLPVAIAVTVTEATLAPVAACSLGNVGKERELTCSLDGAGDLTLMTAAGAGDPSGANLAPFGDEPA